MRRRAINPNDSPARALDRVLKSGVVGGKGVRRINLSKPKIRFGGIENGHEILVPVRRVHIIQTRLKRLNRRMAERPYRPYGPLKNESAIYAERRNRNARIARLALRRIRSNPA